MHSTPRRQLSANTNIEQSQKQRRQRNSTHHRTITQTVHPTMSDYTFTLPDEERRLPNNHHGRREVHGHESHAFSAEELTMRLQKLEQEQERYHHQHHESHHSRLHGPVVQIDADLHKRTQETLHEILERLERRKHENSFLQNDASVVPGMEDNGTGRLRHAQRLNPNVLKEVRSHSHSLRQSHGNANLRHS
ncbi:hypothetical protein BC939DRAFT_453172 [Gamsiella multidivaricata]|uniref:uncharacterized protein n=1 Tax=Gamsiella multidivaricata TaxID=101098 RepID=UPI00221F77C1|nr:uncharacterized protein BC939DRAFT_453172 [Gamsiella multidivaricata]KAI7822635.1 hypothetical protein BC939DRAFT_453172 [Gamsiella multidivaricata]